MADSELVYGIQLDEGDMRRIGKSETAVRYPS